MYIYMCVCVCVCVFVCIYIHTYIYTYMQFCECINLEYVRMHVIYRVHQAEHAICTLMAASPEYVNTYSTSRVLASATALAQQLGHQSG